MKKMGTFILNCVRKVDSKKVWLCAIVLPHMIFPMEQPPSHSSKWYGFFYEKIVQFFGLYNQDSHCSLKDLPCDITHIIASYLQFPDKEYDEECIRRTQLIKQGSPYYSLEFANAKVYVEKSNHANQQYIHQLKTDCSEYKLNFYNKKNNEQICLYSFHDCSLKNKNFKFSLSPDFSKVIILKNFFCLSEIRIQDIPSKQIIYLSQHVCEELPDRNTCNLAIDNIGLYFAYIHELKGSDSNTISYELFVRNIKNDRIVLNISKIPLINIKNLDFNKQCTKVIVHGYDKNELPSYHFYKITSQPESVPQKTLQEYFQSRGVCKHWLHNQ